MSDKTITCVECGRPFTWSHGEQQYYREHGLVQPKRCPDCRSHRDGDPHSGTRGPTRVSSGPTPQRQPRSKARVPGFLLGLIVMGLAIVLAVEIGVSTPSFDLVISWLITINLVTLLIFGYDKAISGTRWTRVPEKALLILALIGGTAGALVGMVLTRHKTSKRSFQLKLLGVMITQAAVIVAYYTLLKPLIAK